MIINCEQALQTEQDPQQTMYAVGMYLNKYGKDQIACVWKDGVRIDLKEPGYNCAAHSYFTIDGDEYVIGTRKLGFGTIKSAVCCWKNGNISYITDTNDICNYNIRSTAVNGNDIYIIGSKTFNSGAMDDPVIWKNGEEVSIIGLQDKATLHDIVIVNNDILICGSVFQANEIRACYWRNSYPHILKANDKECVATKLFVQGSDVYIAGYTINSAESKMSAGYWHNETFAALPTGNTSYQRYVATGIAVHNKTVYTIGHYITDDYFQQGLFWKNDEVTILADSEKYVSYYGIQIQNEDIYLFGFEETALHTTGYACYWKNSVKTYLDNTNYFSVAYDMSFNSD